MKVYMKVSGGEGVEAVLSHYSVSLKKIIILIVLVSFD